MEQFDDDSADGTPVSKIAGGRDGANPLTSCFKVYNFLSNVDDKWIFQKEPLKVSFKWKKDQERKKNQTICFLFYIY